MDNDARRSLNETLDDLTSAKESREALFSEVAGRLAAHDLEIDRMTVGRANSGRLVVYARFGRRGRPLRFCSIEFETRGPLSSLSSATIADAFRNLGPLGSTSM